MSDYQIIAPDRTVEGVFDGNEPIVSGGYGGWQPTSRPRRAALTVWQGRQPFQVSLPMLIDQDGASVQGVIHDLEVIASGTSHGEPPAVEVAGMIVLPTHASGTWVIDDLAWGDRLRRRDRKVTRQQVTVMLLEHVTDAQLAASTAATRSGGRTVVTHYRVRNGDSLHSIAARELGDAKRWIDIAALNGIRSSGQLKVGQVIKLP